MQKNTKLQQMLRNLISFFMRANHHLLIPKVKLLKSFKNKNQTQLSTGDSDYFYSVHVY